MKPFILLLYKTFLLNSNKNVKFIVFYKYKYMLYIKFDKKYISNKEYNEYKRKYVYILEKIYCYFFTYIIYNIYTFN